MLHVYIVKQNESAASIANKFGGSELELIRANPQIPRKVVYYIGKQYTVFKDLFVGQKLIIPQSWIQNKLGVNGVGVGAGYDESCGFVDWCDDPYVCVNGKCRNEYLIPKYRNEYLIPKCPTGYMFDFKTRKCIRTNLVRVNQLIKSGIGIGAGDPAIGVDVSIVGPGESCDFDANSDINKVTPGSLVCGTALVCKNGTCEQIGAPQPDTILCVSDEDCDTDSYCDDNTKNCIVGERSVKQTTPPIDTTKNPSPVGNCTDDAVIKWAQSALPGVNSDGQWGCKSQRALEKARIDYVTLTGCSGNVPDPCVYSSSKCVNNKCPSISSTSGGDQKKDLTKINELD